MATKEKVVTGVQGHTDPFISDTPYTWTQLMQEHEEALQKFGPKFENAKENERILRGRTWSPEEEADFVAKKFTPYSMAQAARGLNAISGAERDARTSVRLVSGKNETDIKAEIGNVVMKNLEQRSNMEYIESDVFEAGFAVNAGVLEIVKDYDQDYNEVPRFRYVSTYDFIWDWNDDSYELGEECQWMARLRRVYRYELADMYGENIAFWQPQGQTFQFGNTWLEYYLGADKFGNPLMDLITLVEHYQKVKRKVYCVFVNDEVVGKFGEKKEAESFRNKKMVPFLSQGNVPDSEIIEMTETKLDKYVFTYAGIIEYEETEYEQFPFSVYRGFHFEHEWWTLTDLVKDPQRWLDRMAAQIDYSMGTEIKNVKQLNLPVLDQTHQSVAEAMEQANTTGGTVIANSAGEAKVFDVLNEQGVHPEWFNLIGLLSSIIEDTMGGRAFQGLASGGRVGWQAQQIQYQNAQKLALIFVDNLQRFKKDLFTKALYFTQLWDTNERIIKLVGGELSQEVKVLLQQMGIYEASPIHGREGQVVVNRDNVEESILHDAQFEVQITEAPLTANDRQVKWQQLEAWAKIYGPPDPTVAAEYFEADYSLKQKLVASAKANMQAAMQAKQQEGNVGQQKVNVAKARAVISAHKAGM